VAWIALIADLGATAALVLSNAPAPLRIGVPSLQALGGYTILIWYVARRK
jgi:hypothetical protein